MSFGPLFFGNSGAGESGFQLIFIVAEEEISGKCQNRKTYLNCSFKRKYQTNTKTGRRVFSKLLKNFLFEEIFKNQNLSKED